MTDLIDQFCDYYHEYNSISEQRRIMQRRCLREWEEFLGDTDLVAGGAQQLDAYLASLVGEFVPKTIGGRLYALRPFFKWLWKNKRISGDTYMELMDVDPPRGASGNYLPRPYSRKEIKQFWLDFDAKYPLDERWEWWLARYHRGQSKWIRVMKSAKRIQLEAIVALALGGALRRDEIFNIELDELEPQAEYVVVSHPARKNHHGEERPRAVPWTTDWMHDSIVRWLDLRERLAPDHDKAWLSLHLERRLEPMNHRQFGGLLAGIGDGYEYHRMRHTAATELLRSGHYQLHEVQKILGHARPQQTLVYAQLLPEDILKTARRAASDMSRVIARPVAA